MINYFTRVVSVLLALLCFISCEKLDYEQDITNFGEVYFVTSNVATRQSLEIHYNGHPVESEQGTGRIRVPEGESKFEFVNSSTGEVLLEKTVGIVAGQPEHFTLFQPVLDAPLMFLDEDAQANEEPAPEGYYKVKFVDYTGDLFFEDKVDIIMWRPEFSWVTWTTEWVETGILASVGKELNEEAYHLIPISDEGLGLSFRDSQTKEKLFIKGGSSEEYITDSFYKDVLVPTSASLPNPKKNVFTAYINTREGNENTIKKEDKFYRIGVTIFLMN